MRLPWNRLTVMAFACAFAPAASAQDAATTEAPPHVAVVDGTATLDREDGVEPATPGMPLVPGDRLRTESGRVEILFPDASALAVDEYSIIDLQAPALVRVTGGRVILVVAGAARPESAGRFQIDTPAASINTYGPGEYRVSVSGPDGGQTELAVVRGAASLATEGGSTPLRAGERSVASIGALPFSPQYFNSARFDAFDLWAVRRRDERLSSTSAQYLPSELRMYGGALDQYGAWEHDSQYGYVWYPNVAADWRPYYDGYWSSLSAYGWTWVGFGAWTWPTHHYGRWGHVRHRWFWIPERHWAPAWVSWGGAPGYVSWCPLDYYNRPVFSFSVSRRHDWNGWNGWTVLSRDHFGQRRHVRQHAIGGRELPANTPFIAQSPAPPAPARAVPRRGVGNAASAGSVDGRRSGFAVPRSRAGDGSFGSRTQQEPRYGTWPDGEQRRSSRAIARRPEGALPQSSPQPGFEDTRRQGRIDAFRSPSNSTGGDDRSGARTSIYSRAPITGNRQNAPADRPAVTSPFSIQRPAGVPRGEPWYGARAPRTPSEAPQPAGQWYGHSRRPSAATSAPPPASAPARAVRPDMSRAPFSPRYQRPDVAPPAAAPAPPPQGPAPQGSPSRAVPRGGNAPRSSSEPGPSAAPAREHSRSRR